MVLRPGNAGSNTFTDHRDVLAAAIRQVPARLRRKILVRVDGAGASHELVDHLISLSSPRRTVLFTCGWMITAADEDAIRQVPAAAWKPGTAQDGTAEADKDIAEITHLMTRAGNWPDGLRWIARRVKPSRRHLRNLTDYEKKTGWKYSITCTNIPDAGIAGVPGSHHPQYIDTVHREHAAVETGGVRTAKAMGLRNLPSKTWQVNTGWVVAANIAADLAAWTRLLGCCDDEGLRDADPDTLRYRIWHIPARLARHARQRVLKISPDWPWKDAFLASWQRWLATISFPAVEPLPIAQPVITHWCAVTFWRYLPQDTPGPEPGPADLGHLLRRLHQFGAPPVPLPAYQPLRSTREAIKASRAVSDTERAWLTHHHERLLASYQRLTFGLPPGLIHGDAWRGNLLRDRGRTVLADWDHVSTGPREIDLIPTLQASRFGLPEHQRNAFVAAYAHDIRSWPGYPVLRDIRELSTMTALLRNAHTDPAARRELTVRLRSLRTGDDQQWTTFLPAQ
jgi:hypothetical protein